MASPFTASVPFNGSQSFDAGGDDSLEGEDWLKRQREKAKADAGRVVPGGGVDAGAAGTRFNKPYVPEMKPPLAQVPAKAGESGYASMVLPSTRLGGPSAGGNSMGSFNYSNGQRVETRGDGREAVYGAGNKFQGYRTTGGGGAGAMPAAVQPAPPADSTGEAYKYSGSSLTPPAEVERRRKAQEQAAADRAAYSASRGSAPAAPVAAPAAAPSPFQMVVGKADGTFYGETQAGAKQTFKTEEEAKAFSSGAGNQQAATDEARATNNFLTELNDENDKRLAEPAPFTPAAPGSSAAVPASTGLRLADSVRAATDAAVSSGPVMPAPRPAADQAYRSGLSSLSVQQGTTVADARALTARREALKRAEDERLRKIAEEQERVKAAAAFKAEGQRKLDAMARGY